SHDFTYLILGIIASIVIVVISVRSIMTYQRRISPGAYVSKLGILFDFNAPALILCQVPMEAIHFLHRQQINISLDEIYIKEMAPYGYVHTTIFESGGVGNVNSWNSPFRILRYQRIIGLINLSRKQLQQGLHSVKKTI